MATNEISDSSESSLRSTGYETDCVLAGDLGLPNTTNNKHNSESLTPIYMYLPPEPFFIQISPAMFRTFSLPNLQ